ncbi:hypothetical protein [Paraburkholderia mimosarum]|uniref:hypothetical protein n=1 Tax=Paraburkholderia mimosarum TaxID=312026 RepID=UPI0003F9F2C2|nr:hypothetical protein [Paraburkholderia mimosarum]
MLNLLIKDVLMSPGKLVAVCFVLYLASMSMFVSLFLALAVGGKFVQMLKRKAKALEAAEAEAERARAEAERVAAVEAQKQATAVAAAAAAAAAQPEAAAPTRQYAKSAVVIPMKRTGTHN